MALEHYFSSESRFPMNYLSLYSFGEIHPTFPIDLHHLFSTNIGKTLS